MWGLEGNNDPRDVWQVTQNINDSIPGKAYFTYEGDGGGAHCCWNDFYNPAVTNWQNMTAPYGNSFITPETAEPETAGTYTSGNVFQWMLRQGDTTLVLGDCSRGFGGQYSNRAAAGYAQPHRHSHCTGGEYYRVHCMEYHEWSDWCNHFDTVNP
jgi:hypothetical protein